MSASKDLYLRDKEEVKRALAITKSDTFERLKVYALAEFMAHGPDKAEIDGANKFLSIFQHLPEDEGLESQPLSSGLNHDLTVPVKTLGK